MGSAPFGRCSGRVDRELFGEVPGVYTFSGAEGAGGVGHAGGVTALGRVGRAGRAGHAGALTGRASPSPVGGMTTRQGARG